MRRLDGSPTLKPSEVATKKALIFKALSKDPRISSIELQTRYGIRASTIRRWAAEAGVSMANRWAQRMKEEGLCISSPF